MTKKTVIILRYDDPGIGINEDNELIPSAMYHFGTKPEWTGHPPIRLYYDPYKQHYAALTLRHLGIISI